jgi:serine/threonine protein kinase
VLLPTPGSTLAHSAILGPLGAGAMGEVYRAKDGRLGREVAISALPEHFADDPERWKHFAREAMTLAALNHPNVAQSFGVDQAGDTCLVVLDRSRAMRSRSAWIAARHRSTQLHDIRGRGAVSARRPPK